MRDDDTTLRNWLLWGVPLGVVLVALGYETDWGRGVTRAIPQPDPPTPQQVQVLLLPEYRLEGGLDARKETVERVLFNPTRRPAPPSTQTAGAQSMQKGLYTLTGTTVAGNVATAFLREVKGGKVRTVRKGDQIEGMVVAEVDAGRVRLAQGGDFEDLQLKLASGPKTTIQSAPAAVATAAALGLPPAAPPQNAAAAGGSAASAQAGARPAAPGAGLTRPATVGELLAERRRAARAAGAAAGQAPPSAQSPASNPR